MVEENLAFCHQNDKKRRNRYLCRSRFLFAHQGFYYEAMFIAMTLVFRRRLFFSFLFFLLIIFPYSLLFGGFLFSIIPPGLNVYFWYLKI
ncbi:MAG: hypothetical protein WC415_05680 [Patescibacteria group bacterium]|jgi:hypothetical protein